MKEVALLNENGRDARASSEIVALLRSQVQNAEHRLAHRRMGSHEEYIAAFAGAEALRGALREAEQVFGRNFKI